MAGGVLCHFCDLFVLTVVCSVYNDNKEKESHKFDHRWEMTQIFVDVRKQLYLLVGHADVLQHSTEVELLNWEFPKTNT